MLNPELDNAIEEYATEVRARWDRFLQAFAELSQEPCPPHFRVAVLLYVALLNFNNLCASQRFVLTQEMVSA